jgi:hypothetical protein
VGHYLMSDPRMYVTSLICVVQAFLVISNQTLIFRKCGKEGRKKWYSLGAAEYLVSAPNTDHY